MGIDLSEVKVYFNKKYFDWSSIMVELEGSSIITIHNLPIWKAKKSVYQIDGGDQFDTKEEYYKLMEEDGIQFVELSDEKFIESLYICDIFTNYSENPKLDKLHLSILFEPDYFNGHYFHVEVDEYMDLTCRGL